MSKMLPQRTVDTFRNFNDVSVDLYGIDCTLYVPNNLNSLNQNNPYNLNKATFYAPVSTKVFMLFSPEVSQLRKLGIFTEEQLPIIAFFKNLTPEVVVRSYFTISMQYIPSSLDNGSFEVVDQLIRHAHDKVMLKAYKVAPRRAS